MLTGYVIVKHSLKEGANSDSLLIPTFNDIHYFGVDRSMWVSIDDYFSKPEHRLAEIYQKYKQLRLSENDGSFISVSNNLHLVESLLNLNRIIRNNNEIIAISSPWINKMKGITDNTVDDILWLGYDIVLLGGWSLIRHGIFENRQDALYNVCPINKYGLIDESLYLKNFLEMYQNLSFSDAVDPLIDDLRVTCIRVGRIKKSQIE